MLTPTLHWTKCSAGLSPSPTQAATLQPLNRVPARNPRASGISLLRPLAYYYLSPWCKFSCPLASWTGQFWTGWPSDFSRRSRLQPPPWCLAWQEPCVLCPSYCTPPPWPLSSASCLKVFLGKPEQRNAQIQVPPVLLPLAQVHGFRDSSWPADAHAHRAALDPSGVCPLNQSLWGCMWLFILLPFVTLLLPIIRETAKSQDLTFMLIFFVFVVWN